MAAPSFHTGAMKANALIVSTLLALFVAGCASAPKEPPKLRTVPVEPVVRPVRPVTPQVSVRPTLGDWRDQPRTAGDWRWVERNEGPAHDAGFSTSNFRSIAVYSVNRENEILALTCNRGTKKIKVALNYPPYATLPGGPVILRTTSTTRPLTIELAESKGGWLVSSMLASDPLLDAMAFSRGRFMVEAPGATPFYIPSWPEISRVIEDCR